MNPISKKKQCGRYYKGENNIGKVDITEADLQKLVDDLLSVRKIKNFHIPDGVWKWLTLNAPKVCALLSGGARGRNGKYNNGLAGCPDNPCFIRLGEKFNLNLMLELKSKKGRLHGKQKLWARDVAVNKMKDPDAVIKLVEEYIEVAEKIKKLCEEKGIEL
ncbi:MAG: hypothetical protein GY853_13995 [PVC group bacterium]|nr:hypothetical protein [PVC group bacterium]